MKTKLLLSGLALLAATTLVSAQTTATTNEQANAPKKGQFYVDNNNDGVCDNFGSRQGTARQGKGQGVCNGQGQGLRQGKGNGQGQGKGQGRNFVDANKDGICDNYQSRTKK